jgi:hypothetical protein
MPSCEFAEALFSPLTCERIFSLIANPAASSPDLFIRRPEESFSKAFEVPLVFTPIWRKVLIAGILC